MAFIMARGPAADLFVIRIKKMKSNTTYMTFAENGLLKVILQDALEVTKDLHKLGTLFKVRCEPKRLLTRREAYITYCGYCASHFLGFLQQLEQIKVFVDDGTVSRKLKTNKINGYHTLLYNIENYLIRTQGLLERTIILIDSIMDFGNEPQFITYNLMKENHHIKRLALDLDLKRLRKATEKHHHHRNQIIHEINYMEDDLRRLEGYYILSESKDFADAKDFIADIKFDERLIRTKWKKDIVRFIGLVYPIISDILDKLDPVYAKLKTEQAV